MKPNAYSIQDSKAQQFNLPFFSDNHATAIRTFSQLASDQNSLPGKYPADFSLIFIGTFDSETGIFTTENHLNLGSLASFSSGNGSLEVVR